MRIDPMVWLTRFSLVGGPAYNDAAAAEELRKAYVRIGNVKDQLGEMAAARSA